ncbi:hypothetical protein Kpol_543p15 [Vanderwaltozyma polyspora DSM 70294]|uniref:Pre-mRNA-splicing factor n=1 Tax=Vanderwaltozyma polyspora (strain ATCC 22028 / DSM 70294 / BCRC 21397 / CBS 2163 / NBRC 10782 / NRRL Y-8283 / UCD 57-17) TaxID=436907 RepID=A7THM0_VANPO|nr:uncharacterized protein Kpol_543p15 [Vanderwaltozyma polyspora DSM 70294]EDO18186.1 hypothetical protein Kpol_543p15 [Vanderwaltozyma polyspora DSM 70294]
MSGFSISLKNSSKSNKKKVKKPVKQKKSDNIFQDGEKIEVKKKAVTLITHVEATSEVEEHKPLVIEPVVRTTEINKRISVFPDEMTSSAPKYGLNTINSNHSHEEQEKQHFDVTKMSHLVNGSLPETTTIEEYEEVPVEEFGEALLRGMGWSGQLDDEKKSKKNSTLLPHEKARAEFAGIGATVPVTYALSNKSLREDSFMPVVKINKQSKGN